MNATECIKTRRSVRKFTAQPVPHDVLEDIISSASFAPSWNCLLYTSDAADEL